MSEAKDDPDTIGSEPATHTVAARTKSPIRLHRLALKELREILRDRRTIITLVLMPLLVYPLLGVTFQKFLLGSIRQGGDFYYQIGVANGRDGDVFLHWMRRGRELLEQNKPTKAKSKDDALQTMLGAQSDELVELRAVQPLPDPMNLEQLEEFVADGSLDAAVMINWKEDAPGSDPTPSFEIIYDQRSPAGRASRNSIIDRIRVVNETSMREIIRSRKIRTFVATTHEHYVSASTKTFSMVTFIPLMLVLMTITGAVYPAIDLTAGERERGTMEILIAAPVPRLSLLFGKFIAVLVVAMLTAVVNLVGMLLTVYTLGLESMIFGADGISVPVVFQIMLLLFVFAAFFSALMLGLTSFARSFKEAQAYLIPLMLVSLAPGLLSLMPDLELTTSFAIIPLVNIVLSGRDLLMGQLVPSMFAITLISTGLYGLLALTLASQVFGTDSILYGSDGSWGDMFRRPKMLADAPSMSTAMLCLAVLFPAFIVVGGLSSRINGSISHKLLANGMVTVLLFVTLPWVFARLSRLRMTTTFFLNRPSGLTMLCALILGCSMWIIAYEISILTLPKDRIEAMKEVFKTMKIDFAAVPLGVKLLALAAIPAICEEFFFRGFLLSAFLRDSKPVAAILGTAGMFGLFHVIVRDSLLFERFLPSAMMGLALGYICWRSGSLFPGIAVHMLHNGLLVTMSHFEKELMALEFNAASKPHLPLIVIIGAGLVIAAGFSLLSWATRRSVEPAAAASN